METQRNEMLSELGKRLALRRAEAGYDLPTLARRAVVDAASIEKFESGGGGLGAGSLARIANVLGVPLGGLLSVSVPTVPAPKQSASLLFSRRLAELSDADREAISQDLERARNLVALNRILGQSPLSEGWGVTKAADRDSHLEGYARAEKVRNALAEELPSSEPLRGLRRLIEDRFAILVRERTFASRMVLGTSCRSGSARVIVISATIAHDSDLRLAMAHELAHHLMDLDGDVGFVDSSEDEVRDAALPGFWMDSTPQEQRARAFAVMLLAPRAAVMRLLGVPRRVASVDEARALVRTVRHDLGIGFDAAAWHLLNLNYLKNKETAEALLLRPDRDEIAGFEPRSTLDGLERRAREALFADEISEARYRSFLGLPYDAMLS
jgi:transcriptional regulator with XRE-family HTH domain